MEIGLIPIQVEPSSCIKIPGPRFIGNYPIALHASEIVSMEFPAMGVTQISDTIVMGGTILILSGKHAIYPDLLAPLYDVMPVEKFGVASVVAEKGIINIRIPRGIKKIEKAVSLLGQCTGNYAHWLTETLPKLLEVNKLNEYADFPLLVDAWIHPNIYQSIECFNNKKREVILVERWETLSVGVLVDISLPSYIPYESRILLRYQQMEVPISSIFKFSQLSLGMLRNEAKLIGADALEENTGKYYLRRSRESVGNGRLIVNSDMVEKIVTEFGFALIDPSKLDFHEQVSIFKSASCIVSPVGAALANAIFTPQGCKIIALAPYYENANYYYLSNLMGVMGHELHYVLGPQVETKGHIAHQDYSIDLNALREALAMIAD
jgi:hypothetical protein